MENTDVTISIVDMNTLRWIVYFVAAAIGGMASSLVNNEGAIAVIGWVDSERTRIKVGMVSDIVIGWAAAAAILWTMTPQTLFQLVGMAAVSGYGGSSILRALLNRLSAEISEKEKKQLQQEKDEIEKGKKVLETKMTEVIDKEKKLDKDKVLINIMEKIAEAKKRAGGQP